MTEEQITRLEELKAKDQTTLTEEEKVELDELTKLSGEEAGATPTGDQPAGEGSQE